MNIEFEAQKIADKYISNGTDMNSSIVKTASINKLGVEQIKRLVEECNKACFISKFASTGEQTFDIADIQKVKEIIQSEGNIEKKASVEFTKTDYSQNNAYGVHISEDDLEKNASENLDLNLAIEECENRINSSMTKIASLRSSFSPLEKIEEIEKEAENYRLIKNHLIEKRAGLSSGLLTAASKVGGTVLNVGAKAGGLIIKHPIKAGLMPLGMISTFKQGAKKATKEGHQMLGNVAGVVKQAEELEKEANTPIADEISFMLRKAAPYALAMGAIGVTAAAAKGMGGLTTRMMQERKLNESFNIIQKNNEDIRQIPNARDYFDVVARHSPSLALDPMVAPQLIRQFDMFGGVDVNTVGKLREIQKNGPIAKDDKSVNEFISGAKSLHSFSK